MTDIYDPLDRSIIKALVNGMTQKEFVAEYAAQREAYLKKYTDSPLDIKKAYRPIDLDLDLDLDVESD